MTLDAFSSAVAMRKALSSSDLSPVELLEIHAQRIERHNPALNAIVIGDLDHAREAARSADVSTPLGGLPMTIKDVMNVKGLPSTGGGAMPLGNIAQADARSVAKLRAAGAVIMGKTNTPTFAADWQTTNPLFGVTNNPWDLARTPGGSTGGGAAAVAAGLSPLELGSDIGGSIRIPASFCGIYGHKPSEGIVPRSGGFASPYTNAATGLAVWGPLARDPRDLEMALDCLVGPDLGFEPAWRVDLPPARHERLADFRVAMLPMPDWPPVQREIADAMASLASDLARYGVSVREANPEGWGDMQAIYRTYRSTMFAITSAGWSDERRAQELADADANEDAFAVADKLGMAASAGQYIAWFGERERYRHAYRRFFEDVDVLICPVAPVLAFPHDERPWLARRLDVDGEAIDYLHICFFSGLATLCGQPSTAFPCGLSADGLPVGLQAIGPFLEDRTPIRFAACLAAERGGFQPPEGYH